MFREQSMKQKRVGSGSFNMMEVQRQQQLFKWKDFSS
jgi:hypothetical protein